MYIGPENKKKEVETPTEEEAKDEFSKVEELFNRWDMEEKARQVYPAEKDRTIVFKSLLYDKDDDYWKRIIETAEKAEGFALVTKCPGDEAGGTIIHSMSVKDVATAIVFLAETQPDSVALALPMLLPFLGMSRERSIHTGSRRDVKDLLAKLEGEQSGGNPLVV